MRDGGLLEWVEKLIRRESNHGTKVEGTVGVFFDLYSVIQDGSKSVEAL